MVGAASRSSGNEQEVARGRGLPEAMMPRRRRTQGDAQRRVLQGLRRREGVMLGSRGQGEEATDQVEKEEGLLGGEGR